jgi:glucosylceramidase
MRRAGLVSIDTKTQALTYSGNYYAFPHYSKVIQRGAHIFASSGDLPGIDHVAAENPDKSTALVLTNRNHAEQRVDCRLRSQVLKVVLPPDSITSFVWS